MNSSSSSSFPSYFASGAISRTQYTLIAKLEDCEAGSSEARKVCNTELRRIRENLAEAPSDVKIAKNLLLLLQILTLRPSCKHSPSFAYISALSLAEGGKTLSHRRTGYLFLQETLSKEDDLVLMLVNTMRKDLLSKDEGAVLLGLNAVIRFARWDLRDSFLPLLRRGRSMTHEIPIIRLRTSHAIGALENAASSTSGPKLSPSHPSTSTSLSISKSPSLLPSHNSRSTILAHLRTEIDPSVISSLLRRLSKSPEKGDQAEDEAWEVLQAVSSRLKEKVSQVHLGLLRAMAVMDAGGENARQGVVVGREVDKRLRIGLEKRSLSGWDLAYLNEISLLWPDVSQTTKDHLTPIMVSSIHILLTPSSLPFRHRSKLPDSTIQPNTHIVALRCLLVLSRKDWEEKLSSKEMEIVLSGVDHMEEQIRIPTLRILRRLDPNLLNVRLDSLIRSVSEENGQGFGADFALEVLRVQIESFDQSSEGIIGASRLARNCLSLLNAIDETELEDGGWVDDILVLLNREGQSIVSLRMITLGLLREHDLSPSCKRLQTQLQGQEDAEEVSKLLSLRIS